MPDRMFFDRIAVTGAARSDMLVKVRTALATRDWQRKRPPEKPRDNKYAESEINSKKCVGRNVRVRRFKANGLQKRRLVLIT